MAAGLAEPTVLVVTDDRAIAEDARYGFPTDTEVVVVPDAASALAWMQERTPSVVIAELRTGNQGGYALGMEMRASDRLARVPLIMVLERVQDAWLARSAGAALWLRAPLDTKDLVARTLNLTASAK